jgi:hypothetical protein
MDIISSFLSGIIPEINEKLSKECEKLNTHYIKGLYYGDEWTKKHGCISVEFVKKCDGAGDNRNEQYFCYFIEIAKIIKENKRYMICSFYVTLQFFRPYDRHESRPRVDSYIFIIDNAFNIYKILLEQGVRYNYSFKYISINNVTLYAMNNGLIYNEKYDIVKKTGFIIPLSNILVDKIKELFSTITIDSVEYENWYKNFTKLQATFIELNKKSHENMLIMKNIQRMLSEKEDRLAKITTELQEANKIITEARIKKGYKIKKCRNVSIKKYLCNFKIKHKKD